MAVKIYIIGKLPPPVGGVTVHVKRLIENLCNVKFNYSFFDLSSGSGIKYISYLLNGKHFHLHTSSVYLRTFSSLFCYVFRKKLLITFHGSIGRYGVLKNIMDKLSIRFCYCPILLNKSSFDIAKQINKNARLISAFIPASDIVPLDKLTLDKIKGIQGNRLLFCTNAHNVAMDKNGEAIYQISTLVGIFNKLEGYSLVISDPSGNYKRYIESHSIPITDNILFLTFNHDFNAVLVEADCFIRYTTTDGDSISVKEALFLGKPVLASNVVDRPHGVHLFNNRAELTNRILNFSKVEKHKFSDTGINDLILLYKNI